jgi:hypothetical protein
MNIALHQTLGIDLNRRIPERTLRAIIATPIGRPVQIGYRGVIIVDNKLKYRANFALNAGQGQSGGF